MAQQQSADSNPAPQEVAKADEQQLKYLEFVQVATLHALIYFSKLYNVAKDKSGPLKPGVQTVEGTIKSVVGPVYEKFHDVPNKVIKYIDGKVDESMTSLNHRVPPMVKQVTNQAVSVAQTAPSVARSVATEVKKAGVVDTATGLAKSVYTKYEPTAKELYSKYEPVAEQCAVSTWRKLNQLPVFPKVAQAVLPTAAYCTQKYNQTVQLTFDKGYKVSTYLPLVPTEKIAKIFSPESAPVAAAAVH
ncbi:unnamed protein product [Rhodiola kirilowii]